MRCECCNKILSDYEATQKFKGSGEYTNMCKECTTFLPDDVEVVGRDDLDLDEYDGEYDER